MNAQALIKVDPIKFSNVFYAEVNHSTALYFFKGIIHLIRFCNQESFCCVYTDGCYKVTFVDIKTLGILKRMQFYFIAPVNGTVLLLSNCTL